MNACRWRSVFFFLTYGAREPASSDGASSHRKTAMGWLAHLRRADAGQRRGRCGWTYSCEDAVIGGDHHLGCSPPAEVSFAGGNHSSDGADSYRKTALRRLAQLRRANAGRRRMSCGRLYSCEAAVVGGNRHFGCSLPAERWFTGGNHSSDGASPHRKTAMRWLTQLR